MNEQIIHQYKSRRNTVQLVRNGEDSYVKKLFECGESCVKEESIYKILENTEIPHATLIKSSTKELCISPLPGDTLLECLEAQEKSGVIQWPVWEKLIDWLVGFKQKTDFIMSDVNLRNFLYDENTETVYGLDFEECAKGDIVISLCNLAAFVSMYEPENTIIKQQISEFILKNIEHMFGVDRSFVEREKKNQEQIIRLRRNNKK